MEDNKDNTLQRKIAYVLDTNVLIHNPDSVLNFEEHRVIIPMTVLEELADLHLVGMDCVEVSPPYDHAELSSQAAAVFVWTYLCGRVARAAAA